jgi:hypothetical protein
VHRHRHLDHPQPVRVDHQDRLDLGVVVRVVAGEQLDRPAVGEPEAGGGIRDALAGDQRQQPGEDPDPHAAVQRRAVARGLREPRAVHEVDRVVGAEDVGQRLDLRRVVLTVAVDLHRELVVVLLRVDIAGLHRAADAEVERQPHDHRARPLGAARRVVGGSVVDHQHVELGRVHAQPADDAGDGARLVVGGHDGEAALGGHAMGISRTRESARSCGSG